MSKSKCSMKRKKNCAIRQNTFYTGAQLGVIKKIWNSPSPPGLYKWKVPKEYCWIGVQENIGMFSKS